MEEDIDIEEHDVLDHPQIRNIFPDLSLVKTELPDPDDDFQEDYIIDIKEEPLDYEYEHNDDNEHTNETTNYYPNKIILGSKPTQVQVKKEYLPAQVLLEDYSLKLKDNPSYCEKCQRLFPTPNVLDAHNMSAHSFLVAYTANKAKKSTAKILGDQETRFCAHCNVVFPNNNALIKHLYQLLPGKLVKADAVYDNDKMAEQNRQLLGKTVLNLNNSSEGEQIMRDVKTKDRYKCTLCNVIISKSSAKYHKIRKHPNCGIKRGVVIKLPKGNENSKIHIQNTVPKNTELNIRRTVPKITEVNIQNTVPKHIVHKNKNALSKNIVVTAQNKNRNRESYIPKSLFQCPKCKLHFTSIWAASMHDCSENTEVWKCVCQKKFPNTPREKHFHLLQHKHKLSLKTCPIVRDLFEKVLCRCPSCDVHVGAKYFKSHFKQCGKLPTVKCKKCSVKIVENRLEEHKKKHNSKLYIVEYYRRHQPDTVKAKPKVLNEVYRNVTNKPNLKILVYYCEFCKRCVHKVQPIHHSRDCVSSVEPTEVCLQCGLAFPYSSMKNTHARYHAKGKITLKDVKVVSAITGKQIAPPMPEYFKCTKCDINFKSKFLAKNHICGEDEATCDVCLQKFNTNLLPGHRMFHELDDNEDLMETNEDGNTEGSNDNSESEMEENIMPELLKKYESLNPIWNLIFKCARCDVASDSYDKIVEHSQQHIEDPKSVLKSLKCYVCQLKIDEAYWPKHSDLHTKMKINASKFQTLVYDPQDLLNESWYQMFEHLPEDQISLIVDKSVYCHERCVKMKLVKDGRSEFTIYICNSCLTAVSQEEIKNHMSKSCERGTNYCSVCKISFNEDIHYIQHTRLHKKGVNQSEFRIVSFLKQDQTFNKPKYTAFICIVCSTTIIQKQNIKRHNCTPNRKHIFKCDICMLAYPPKIASRHKAAHRKILDYVQGNIDVQYFFLHRKGPLIFETKEEAEKYNETKIKRSKIGSKPKSIVKEITKKGETTEKVIEKKRGRKKKYGDVYLIYKCRKCPISLFQRSSAKVHRCNRRKPLKHCKICKQSFIAEQFNIHSLKHKKDPKFVYKNCKLLYFKPLVHEDDVLQLDSSESEAEKTKKNQRVDRIYKCNCGIHYLSINSIEKHKKVCRKQSISTENCSKCNLLFSTDVLVTHLCKHHMHDTKLIVENMYENDTESASVNSENQSISLGESENPNISGSNSENPNVSNAEYTNYDQSNDYTDLDDSQNPNASEAEEKNLNETDHENQSITDSEDLTNSKSKKSKRTRAKKLLIPKEPGQIRLYKCADCNVHYINHNTCYKHVLKHQKLSPKQYIECKICALQFTIYTLALHLRRHHESEFSLDKVVIEEYKPSSSGPQILDVYNAIDRDQSLLVSSSNDVETK